MSELIFEVTQEADGGFCADCLTESIFTQGDTWEQLRDNVREAVRAFYFDQPKNLPSSIRLHQKTWSPAKAAPRLDRHQLLRRI